MRCAEPLQGKAASSFFSVTYFRLEIKYKRKFVAMTYEEQISLFDASNTNIKMDDIILELHDLDLSEITPIDAMNILYRMQMKLKERM